MGLNSQNISLLKDMYFLSCSLGQSVAPSADVSNQSNFIDRMKATVSKCIYHVYVHHSGCTKIRNVYMYPCGIVEHSNICTYE